MPVILVYGDSNSHGTPPISDRCVTARHGHKDRWPNVMAAKLGKDYEVISEALPGRTTVHEDVIEGGARNGLAVLPAALHSHKPLDLVMIMLGTNDLKPRFSVRALEIAASIARLVREVQASGTARAVMIVVPVDTRETGTLKDDFAGSQARQKGLADRLRQVANDLGCGFMDANKWARVSDIDGVHLAVADHHSLGRAAANAVTDHLNALNNAAI